MPETTCMYSLNVCTCFSQPSQGSGSIVLLAILTALLSKC